MQPETVQRDLKTAMLGLAANDFKRRHPAASEAEAWVYAHRNYRAYSDQAVTVLTMLYLEEETKAEARDRRN